MARIKKRPELSRMTVSLDKRKADALRDIAKESRTNISFVVEDILDYVFQDIGLEMFPETKTKDEVNTIAFLKWKKEYLEKKKK